MKLDWPSDLVQIETDPGKAQSAVTAVEGEPAARPRRVRPVPLPMSDEPLVQVETRGSEGVVGS
jgi:hypothetical protein